MAGDDEGGPGAEGVVVGVGFDRRHRDALVLLEALAQLRNLHGAFGVEIDAGAETVAPERLLDAGIENLEDDGVVLEFDLRLGRVDVDVDGVRVRLQEDEVGGRDPVRDHFFVGLHHSLVEIGAAEVASVDEEVLVAEGLAGGVGAADEAAHAHLGGVGRQVHDVSDHVVAEQVEDAEFLGFGFFQDKEFAAVVGEGEGDLRARERHAGELFQDVLQLDVVALEELAAGRGVVEEVAYGEIGAHGGCDRGRLGLAEGAHAHFGARFVLLAAGAEGHFRHGGDAGQRLASEAVGEDLFEVFGRGDLGGGVPLEAEHGIDRAHAAAVVDDLQQGAAGVGHDHGDLGRAGIDGILHQLLHHGRRPLYDLARGDHVGDLRREDFQLAHPLEQGVEFGDVPEHDDDQQQRDDADDRLDALHRGARARSFPEGSLDVGTWHIGSFFLLLLHRAVHGAEAALALFFRRIVVDRFVVEYPVFVVTEEIKKCHNSQI